MTLLEGKGQDGHNVQMKGAMAYLLLGVGKSNGFFLISISSMQVVCFLSASIVFANSFMLQFNLALENSVSGKHMHYIYARCSRQQFSMILCSLEHVTIYLLWWNATCFILREWERGRGAVVTAGGCCGQFNLWFAAEMFRIFNMSTKTEDICAS